MGEQVGHCADVVLVAVGQDEGSDVVEGPGDRGEEAGNEGPVRRCAAVDERDVVAGLDQRAWRRAQRLGFSDAQVAYLLGETEEAVRAARFVAGVQPTFTPRRHRGAAVADHTPTP